MLTESMIIVRLFVLFFCRLKIASIPGTENISIIAHAIRSLNVGDETTCPKSPLSLAAEISSQYRAHGKQFKQACVSG
jgi:Mg-chelatase subunit ChlD